MLTIDRDGTTICSVKSPVRKRDSGLLGSISRKKRIRRTGVDQEEQICRPVEKAQYILGRGRRRGRTNGGVASWIHRLYGPLARGFPEKVHGVLHLFAFRPNPVSYTHLTLPTSDL